MPNTPNEVNRLKLGIITGGEEVWSNAQMEPTGEWFVIGLAVMKDMIPEYYQVKL